MPKDHEEKWHEEDRKRRIADQRKRDEELQKVNENEEAETVRQRIAKLAKKITHYDRVDSDVELEFQKMRGSDRIREDLTAMEIKRQREVEADRVRVEGARKVEQDRQVQLSRDREAQRLAELRRQDEQRRRHEEETRQRNERNR